MPFETTDYTNFLIKTDLIKKQNSRKFLSFGVLKVQKFLDIQNLYTKCFIVVLLAIFMGFVNFFLIERTGIYAPGINALHQSIARLTKVLLKNSITDAKQLNVLYYCLFWGLNIMFNVVCAYVLAKKMGPHFIKLTCLYISVVSLTGLCISMAPESWGFKWFYIFSDPKSTNSSLNDNNINMLPWPTSTYASDGYKVPIMMLYGLIYAAIGSTVSLIIYSMDGGMGGLDWVVFYLYKKKTYSSNKLFFYLGLIVSFMAYIIGTYVPFLLKASPTLSLKEALPNLISPTLFATIIAIYTKKVIFDTYYPQFKFVKVTVFSNKFLEIRSKLLDNKFAHSFTITNSIGSYKLKHQTQLEFICFAIELSQLVKCIREVDKDCLITSTKISTINGYLKVNT